MDDKAAQEIIAAVRQQASMNSAIISVLIELVKLIDKPGKHAATVDKIEIAMAENNKFFDLATTASGGRPKGLLDAQS